MTTQEESMGSGWKPRKGRILELVPRPGGLLGRGGSCEHGFTKMDRGYMVRIGTDVLRCRVDKRGGNGWNTLWFGEAIEQKGLSPEQGQEELMQEGGQFRALQDTLR